MPESQGQVQIWMRQCSTYFRLLAFEDEYEVARLHTDPSWVRTTLGQFDAGAQLYFHFAPAWLTRNANRAKKIKMGTWVLALLKLLAALRGIRGSWIDPFKGSLERKNQNLLIDWFETWAELMHNNPSMLHHSKTVVHVQQGAVRDSKVRGKRKQAPAGSV